MNDPKDISANDSHVCRFFTWDPRRDLTVILFEPILIHANPASKGYKEELNMMGMNTKTKKLSYAASCL